LNNTHIKTIANYAKKFLKINIDFELCYFNLGLFLLYEEQKRDGLLAPSRFGGDVFFSVESGREVAAARGVQRGRGPFGLLGHFQRCGAMREENALIGYAFCKKARVRSGRSVGDGAAVMSVSRGSR